MPLSSTDAPRKRHCRPSINLDQPSRCSLVWRFPLHSTRPHVLFQRRMTPGPVITSRNCLPPGETIRPATLVLSYRQGSVGLSLRVHCFLSRGPTRSTRSVRTTRPPRPVQSTTDLHRLGNDNVLLPCSNNKASLRGPSVKSPSSGQTESILSSSRNGKVTVACPDVKEPTLDVIDKNCSIFMKTSYRRFSGAFTASGPRLRSERHA